MKDAKVAICVPFYGSAAAMWWSNFGAMCAKISNQVTLTGIHTIGTMATDHNRNTLVDSVLKTPAEWILWIDTDNTLPDNALQRLLDTAKDGKKLVSGLYYGKGGSHPPIAYVKYKGAYRSIHEVRRWERGEIIAVDACGFGCMLTHRSVFEQIRDNYKIFQREGGGLVPVHKDDIKGSTTERHRDDDGTMVSGQLRTRMFEPTLNNLMFPYFGLEYGMTEDFWFFRMAERMGEKPWIDTGVECGHVSETEFTGADYREIYGA